MTDLSAAATGGGLPAETLVRILGPVSATVAGRPCQITSPRQRALLAVLAASAGRVVSVDRLVDELWGDTAPAAATSTLQVYVSRLRQSFGDAGLSTSSDRAAARAPSRIAVRRRPPGYVLELPADGLDAWRLEQALAQARAQLDDDPAAALAALESGLAEVSGEPLADVVDGLGPSTAADAQRLRELVLAAREARVEALLSTGRAREAATAAEQLLVDQPLHEGVQSLRLLALYRCGRQSEALGAYDAFRTLLADDLGIDPGPALRRLHTQMLNQDPALDPRLVAGNPAPPTAARIPGSSPVTDPSPAADDVRPDAPRHGEPMDAGPDEAPAESGLVGREHELEDLQGMLTATAAGQGGVFVLSGEAGIGKTSLVREVMHLARAQRIVVAEGRAQETTTQSPYWPWIQVLRQLGLSAQSGPVAVIEGLAADDDASPSTSAALHDAVADLLASLTGSAALLLVLDDLQWADEASMALLETVCEKLAGRRAAVLVARRTEDTAPTGPLAAWLARLARRPEARRLALRGLNTEQAHELLARRLGHPLDPAVTALATERTAGNPFYLAEVARLVTRSGGEASGWHEVPGTVREVLAQRLLQLSGEARRLLDVAAVVGRECDLGLLETCAGLRADQVDSGLAEAVRSGLVLEVEARRPLLRFPHALVRETVYDQLGSRARRRLHAAVGQAMLSLPGVDPDEIASQLLAGSDLSDAVTTVTAVLRAIDRAMVQLAYDHALGLVDQVAAVLGRLTDAETRDRLELGVQARHGTVLATQLGFAAPQARAALERSKTIALRLDPSPDVHAALYRHYLWLLMSGDYAAVERLADDVLTRATVVEPGPGARQLELLGRLAQGSVSWCLGDADLAVNVLRRARQLAEGDDTAAGGAAFGDPAVRVEMFLCHALAATGRLSEAREAAAVMVRLARESGPADESDALATRGMMFAALRQPAEAQQDGVDGLPLAIAAGAPLLQHFAVLNRDWGEAASQERATTGTAADLSATLGTMRDAVSGYEESGTHMHDPIVYTMLAETEAAAGHAHEAAAAALKGLQSMAGRTNRPWRERLQRVLDDSSKPESIDAERA